MSTRDHGGDLARAINTYGGTANDWIDLSTGINRRAYPVPMLSDAAWRSLPDKDATANLLQAARTAYRTTWPMTQMAGAQAAIQLLPRLATPGEARILSPTYNEFQAALNDANWTVTRVTSETDLPGADVAIVVNPNNPTGHHIHPEALHKLAQKVGILIVDESFGDATPDLSLLPGTMPENVVVLRSFGKFFGLAGARLGFVAGPQNMIDQIQSGAGPWPASGPAIEIGTKALNDLNWQDNMRTQLAEDASRMDSIAIKAAWIPVGGTHLFRTYDTGAAAACQEMLANSRIWSRIFPYSNSWMRLGFPGSEEEWERFEDAAY
ncbi:MAG: threonine-phosphate decarboxylase [Boseongicola sp.]|nr:MAG: threonine-phosphate decarboxylase [Boseongicola sp.]